MRPEELIGVAAGARQRAYAPYSGYPVGAALEGTSGQVYTGCNVENVSYGLTTCAERAAVFAAVCAGERAWRALAVVSADGAPPCGACRQVLAEFGGGELVVYAATLDGRYRAWRLEELLPEPFRSREVKREA